jgi:ATP-dependent exoDNAse (exonuclease V) beta subunit
VERLHIIAAASSSNNLSTVSDWITDFSQAAPGLLKNGIYERGTLQAPQSRHTSNSLPGYDLEPLRFDTNKNIIRIKASYLNKSEKTEDARQQGILIHWLLSKVGTAGDHDTALQQALLEGLISLEDLPVLRKKLDDITGHAELAPYFEAGKPHKLEAELVTQAGEVLRPDRIVFLQEETVLIDYKTGKENNRAYFKQLDKYEAALRSMGYSNIRKLLVYLDEIHVVSAN